MRSRSRVCLLLREHGVSGGAETVNLHLIPEFLEMVDRIVWIMPGWRRAYFQRRFPASDRLIYADPGWPNDSRVHRSLEKAVRFCLRRNHIPMRGVLETAQQHLSNLWLRELIRRHRITHCFFNWTLWVNPPALDIPMGAMLMDVRWRRYPETFAGVDLERIDQQFQQWLKQSDIVFPVSEATAADIKHFYPWYNGRMAVVPHGSAVSAADGLNSQAPVRRPSRRPVFYCPGVAHRHKDHITLFQAAAALRRKGRDFDLVLTGIETDHLAAKHPLSDPAIEACREFLIEHEELFGGRIKPLGYIARPDVDAWYRDCTAVVLPSFFEGFGLSLLEALEHGARIICTDIPAHREQLNRYGGQDGVMIVPPQDVESLAVKMEEALFAGPCQSTNPPALDRWTWKDAAAAYIDSLVNLSAVTSQRPQTPKSDLLESVPS